MLPISWDIQAALAVLTRAIALGAAFVLAVFTVRRALFAITILLARPASPAELESADLGGHLPDLLILASCRNESTMIAGLCTALDSVVYPRERLQIVLIDDGSTDDTHAAMLRWTHSKPGWHVQKMPANAGKANALNAALKQHAFGDIVYVFDADHRPQPDALMRAARYFQDSSVGGMSGRTASMNGLDSPSAFYAAVEGDVHQLVTMRAKDRLRLAPALLGSNCGYRSTVLNECGGFPGGALLEDSALTLAIRCAGYNLRFAEDVITHHQVPTTIRGYLHQHIRWARGFNDVAGARAPALFSARTCAVPWPVRLELALFSAGYLDRLALMAGVALLGLSALNAHVFWFPAWLIVLSLVMPLIQIMLLFVEQRAPLGRWLRLPLVPLFFLLDLYAAGRGMLDTLMRKVPVWTATERVVKP